MSEGPFASLNLGRKTGDDVERVDENRRRACAEIGADAERLALNYQVHSTLVHRARAGARGERGDGLWTDEPDLPILAMSADCLPVALARTNGGAPAVAVVHVGWRGLLDGILESAVDALGGGDARGRDRAGHRAVLLRGARGRRRSVSRALRRAGSSSDGKLDLWRAAEAALRDAGVDARRPLRPLHGVPPGALLLPPPRRQAARSPGSARACRLTRSASGTSGSSRRSGRR